MTSSNVIGLHGRHKKECCPAHFGTDNLAVSEAHMARVLNVHHSCLLPHRMKSSGVIIIGLFNYSSSLIFDSKFAVEDQDSSKKVS